MCYAKSDNAIPNLRSFVLYLAKQCYYIVRSPILLTLVNFKTFKNIRKWQKTFKIFHSIFKLETSVINLSFEKVDKTYDCKMKNG